MQAQILKLLDGLQTELSLTYVFISHDLAVVRQIADTVSVMSQGRLMQNGPTEDLFTRPQTHCTRTLLDAIPRLGFFTRLLEDAPAEQRYRFALEQLQAAETHGFDSAWVAQHHFSAAEGGLPSPLVFLSHAADAWRSDSARAETRSHSQPSTPASMSAAKCFRTTLPR